MAPFIMIDILILENICFLEDLANGAFNFISGRDSDALDLTLPILLYKSTFSIIDSFYIFKIHCYIVFNKWNYESNAKPIRFYLNINSYLCKMRDKYYNQIE